MRRDKMCDRDDQYGIDDSEYHLDIAIHNKSRYNMIKPEMSVK